MYGPVPGTDFRRRLLLAHGAWQHVADAESDHLARAWFIGANPNLNEDTPHPAIREDRAREIMDAVHVLTTDRQDA